MDKAINKLDELLNSDWKDFLGKDENIKDKLERLVSAWNGEDNEFIFEGSIYTEADVESATEALALIK